MEIRGTDQSAIDVMAKETIRADDENAAKRISDNLKLEMVEEAEQDLLRSNRRSLGNEGRYITLDMSLRVPKATSSEASSESGDNTNYEEQDIIVFTPGC